MRIGHGFDVHKFTTGDFVTLGGVKIAHTQGIEAHSDGDVILHALCDGLLGAAALGDIGEHFPPTDDRFKDMDSRKFVRTVNDLINAQGLRLVNADITLVAQVPRIKAHKQQMREHIAHDLSTGIEQINIKGTTTEKLGYLGRAEGLAAHAVVLLDTL